MRLGIGIANQQTGEPDRRIESEQGGQNDQRALEVYSNTEGDDCKNKTDGAPKTDAGITRHPLTQVVEHHGFELWQHRIPEEAEEHHCQPQLPKTLEPEDGNKDHAGQQRPQPDDNHAPPQMVAKPTPDIGGDKLGSHRYSHQLTDGDGIETEALEVESPVGNQTAEGGKIEKIEA